MNGAVVVFGANVYGKTSTLVANSVQETQSDASSVMEDKLTNFPLSTSALTAMVPTGQAETRNCMSSDHFLEDCTLNVQHVIVTEPVVECHSAESSCEAKFAVCDQPDATEFKTVICTMGSWVSGEEKPQCNESGTCKMEKVAEQHEGLDVQPVNNSPCQSISTTPCGLKMTNMDRECYVTLERIDMTPTPTLTSSARRVKFGTVVFGKMPAPPTPQRSILKSGNRATVSDVESSDNGSSDCVPEFGSSYNVSELRKNYDLRDRSRQMMPGISPNNFDQSHLQLRCSLRLLHKSNSPSYFATEENPAESALADDLPDVTRRFASRKRKLFPSNDRIQESPKRLCNGTYQTLYALPLEAAAPFVNGTSAGVEAGATEMEADQEVIAACYRNGPKRKVRPPSLLGDCYVSLRQMDTSSFSDGTVILSEEMVEKLSDKGCQASLQMPSQESPVEMDHGVCAKVEDDDTSVQTPLRCLTPSSAKIMKLMESVSRGIDAVEKLKGK